MNETWLAIWGNGHTGEHAGCLGEYQTREEARAECDRFLRDHADNTALGAWTVPGDRGPDEWDH